MEYVSCVYFLESSYTHSPQKHHHGSHQAQHVAYQGDDVVLAIQSRVLLIGSLLAQDEYNEGEGVAFLIKSWLEMQTTEVEEVVEIHS